MTNTTNAHRRNARAVLPLAAIAALGLSACAPDDAEETTEDTGQAEEMEQEDTGEESPEGPSPDETTDEGTADEGDATTEDDTATEDDPTDADAGSGGDHPVYQAVESALAEYDGGVITEFEDNTNDGGYVEVFVYDGETEWELEVDSESFEIIDTEDDGIDADDREEAEAVEIEISEAIQTAESEGGAEPTDGELETEDGTVVWQIELDNDMEVYVDVTNGDVVTVDQ